VLAEAEAQLADRRYRDRLAKEEERKRFVPNRRQPEQERLDKLAKKEETKQRSEEAIGELRDAAAAEKEATQFSLKAIRALKEDHPVTCLSTLLSFIIWQFAYSRWPPTDRKFLLLVWV